MIIADGFAGQKLVVLPRPVVAAALGRPGTSRVVVTDCGFFPRARSHGMHRPDEVPQAIVIACVQGVGWYEAAGSRHDVRAGQVVVIPPATPHAYGADATDPWSVWWLHAAGAEVGALLDSTGYDAASPVYDFADIYRVVGLLEEVVETLERDATGPNVLSASGAAWHLFTTLLAQAPAPRGRASAIEHARRYLRDHPAARTSVAELAAMANLSPSHFAALFRRQVGMSVVRYQTDLRMARARNLLDTTERPIANIAREVGYVDAFYFTRQFSALHGMTPRSYRAQHKG